MSLKYLGNWVSLYFPAQYKQNESIVTMKKKIVEKYSIAMCQKQEATMHHWSLPFVWDQSLFQTHLCKNWILLILLLIVVQLQLCFGVVFKSNLDTVAYNLCWNCRKWLNIAVQHTILQCNIQVILQVLPLKNIGGVGNFLHRCISTVRFIITLYDFKMMYLHTYMTKLHLQTILHNLWLYTAKNTGIFFSQQLLNQRFSIFGVKWDLIL